MQTSRTASRKRLSVFLAAVFVLALIMGPGPGLYLVNPDRSDPDAMFLFLGMPVVYVWAVFWFFVQAAVVLTAYCTLWRPHRGAGSPL